MRWSTTGFLDAEHIGQFKTLILPNIAALSNEQCEQLRQFVRRGGSLVATYETSLYDEWGVRRSNFGLADLLGVSFGGRMEGRCKTPICGWKRTQPPAGATPVLAGLEEAPRIINGVWRVEVKATERFVNPPLTLIPSYPDLPMEMVYPRVAKTDIPKSICANSTPWEPAPGALVQIRIRIRNSEFKPGASRARSVYFPWDIDRVFGKCCVWITASCSAMPWTGHERGKAGHGHRTGVLDVTVWQQKQSMTVHLVNLTNPMMMKGPFREFLPVGEQKSACAFPAGKGEKVQLLVSGKPARVSEVPPAPSR